MPNLFCLGQSPDADAGRAFSAGTTGITMTLPLTEQLVQWRRELHEHPELSNHEFATTERLSRWLTEAGIRLLPLGLKTGVVAEMGHGEALIALRADIDALP